MPLLNLDELFEEKIRIAHQVKEQLRSMMWKRSGMGI